MSNAEIVIVLVLIMLLIWYMKFYEGSILILWDDEILPYREALSEFSLQVPMYFGPLQVDQSIEFIKSTSSYFIYILYMEDQIIKGTCCLSMRELPDLALNSAWYISDLKIAPDCRNRELPARMIKKALVQGTGGLYGTKMFGVCTSPMIQKIYETYGFAVAHTTKITYIGNETQNTKKYYHPGFDNQEVTIKYAKADEPSNQTNEPSFDMAIMVNGLESMKSDDWSFLTVDLI